VKTSSSDNVVFTRGGGRGSASLISLREESTSVATIIGKGEKEDRRKPYRSGKSGVKKGAGRR